MSLLHLLGVDDLSFDGKGLDKTIDNSKRLANNKFSEDDVDYTNNILQAILSRTESIEIEPRYLYGIENKEFIKYLNFDFIPDSAILNRSHKSGQVCYVSGDWEFELSAYVGYGGLQMTPNNIRYKHLDFCKAYDKIIEIGLDPQKLTIEDVQLLKIVDNHNSLSYDLFVKNN